MKIAILGYGKMGREIESMALELGHSISCIIDVADIGLMQSDAFTQSDVVIEFTSPLSAPDNIKRCIDMGIAVVTGSTGWYNRLSEITSYCEQHKGCMFYASNFSIGMNVFFEINRNLARFLSNHNNYNARLEETHHLQKLDKPSGTAISLANDIVSQNKQYVKWSLNMADDISTLPVFSFREGDVTGQHSIVWDSMVDTISISHEAKNRKGFAMGAIMAAEFCIGKQGVFQMSDLLNRQNQ